jgi:hypothetical protein
MEAKKTVDNFCRIHVLFHFLVQREEFRSFPIGEESVGIGHHFYREDLSSPYSADDVTMSVAMRSKMAAVTAEVGKINVSTGNQYEALLVKRWRVSRICNGTFVTKTTFQAKAKWSCL